MKGKRTSSIRLEKNERGYGKKDLGTRDSAPFISVKTGINYS